MASHGARACTDARAGKLTGSDWRTIHGTRVAVEHALESTSSDGKVTDDRAHSGGLAAAVADGAVSRRRSGGVTARHGRGTCHGGEP